LPQLIHTSFLAGTRSYPQATYLLQKSPWFLLCSTRPTPICVTSKKLRKRGRLSWFAERFGLFHRPRCATKAGPGIPQTRPTTVAHSSRSGEDRPPGGNACAISAWANAYRVRVRTKKKAPTACRGQSLRPNGR